jgi:hypothetical protein
MNEGEYLQIVSDWMDDATLTLTQVKEALVRLGYSVQVIYEPAGITVGIVKAGRGQLHSGIVEGVVLYELVARMIESGDLPATAAPPRPAGEVGGAGQEVAVNQESEGIRSTQEERLPEEQRSGDLEQHGKDGKAPKAKKVK